MKRILKGLGAVACVVFVVLGSWIAANWTVLSTFPMMPSSYEAKEFCSCRFVSDRDGAFCAAFVKQSTVPMQGREVDEAAKTVTSRALWTSSTARYVDERRGCVLDR